jgi:hypothetical protein
LHKVSNKEKSKISGSFFDCIEKQASEMSRCVSFTMDPKHKLEKQKKLIEMELPAGIGSDAYEEGDSVEDLEVEVELLEESDELGSSTMLRKQAAMPTGLLDMRKA